MVQSFKQWKRDLEFVIVSMDNEMDLTVDKHNDYAADNSSQEKIEANKMCI